MKPSILTFFFFLFFSRFFFAQDLYQNFIPCFDYEPTAEEYTNLINAFNEIEVTFPEMQRKTRKEYEELLLNRKEMVERMKERSSLMTSDSSGVVLKEMLSHIVASNPGLLTKEYQIFILRTFRVNAFNMGGGVVFISEGLLSHVRSLDEIAFVICHELAHDIEQHTIHSARKRAQILTDKSFKKEVRRIKRMKYNQSSAISEFSLSLQADIYEKSVDKELQADSLGLQLFLNTDYDYSKVIDVMNTLSLSDWPIYRDSIQLDKHLSFDDFPFQDDWTKTHYETDIGGNLEKLYEIPDSLKTHPDTELRIEEIAKTLNLELKEAPADSFYTDLKNLSPTLLRARFEMLHLLAKYDNRDYQLYHSLQLLEHFPENQYLKNSVAEALYEIYAAALEHEFSAVVNMPSSQYHPAFNQIVNFLHSIRTSEIKELAKIYAKQHVAPRQKDDVFSGYVMLLINSMDQSEKERAELAATFKKQFDNEEYHSKLKNKFITK
ncbi:M48 family metalloprotease [Halocola ammonii]